MSKELQEIIELGLKFGIDVSNITEQQALDIIKLSNELKY
jgi:hypothetical protein